MNDHIVSKCNNYLIIVKIKILGIAYFKYLINKVKNNGRPTNRALYEKGLRRSAQPLASHQLPTNRALYEKGLRRKCGGYH